MNEEVREIVGRALARMERDDPQGVGYVRQALHDQDAEIARHVKMLADCFRMAGADPDGNEDCRIAPDALRAVTDLRRDYDEVLDWQARAERAAALLRRFLKCTFIRTHPMQNSIEAMLYNDGVREEAAAHLSENSHD